MVSLGFSCWIQWPQSRLWAAPSSRTALIGPSQRCAMLRSSFEGPAFRNVVQGRHRGSGDCLRMHNEATRPKTDCRMLGCAASKSIGSFRQTLRGFGSYCVEGGGAQCSI